MPIAFTRKLAVSATLLVAQRRVHRTGAGSRTQE